MAEQNTTPVLAANSNNGGFDCNVFWCQRPSTWITIVLVSIIVLLFYVPLIVFLAERDGFAFLLYLLIITVPLVIISTLLVILCIKLRGKNCSESKQYLKNNCVC